ncbi:hypothetical protein M422DRAFT_273830 [Sphaerobolus stellatus SS14]|uniref:Uncharacterized protein n=1 Tax=Sphaerobolus stellatus (strain SS14) TaxID=990650 RepID=A0A0C9T882_SPHS4|nr:hypothetical protein M422DRAFT_273830 [Sphaerobolus stellatus SS14]
MAPKKRTVDKVPAGTGDAADSSSTPNVIGGDDPTMDPGKDPSKTASAVSEANTIHPTTQNTHATNEIAHPASERGTSEDPTKTPNPHNWSGDPLFPKTYSDYAEPSERSALADPDPKELVLDDQIQEILDTINEHMDELIQSTDGSNNRSNPKQVLGKAQTKLLAKTAVLGQLYADQAPADHLNQTATAAQNTSGLVNPQDQEQLIQPSENARETVIWDYPCKSIRYTPFNGIEDNDTDSEMTVRNHQEGSVPFQQPDDRDILDMSNNESDNALV